MPKKLAVIAVLLVLALIVGGCGKSAKTTATADSEQKNNIVTETAQTILKLKEDKQWDELYGYLHPDVQAISTKSEFVKNRSEEVQHTKIKYDDFKVGKYTMLKEWQEAKGSTVYKDVAEVSYTVQVETAVGKKEISNVMHLAKDKDGKWKYLWFKK